MSFPDNRSFYFLGGFNEIKKFKNTNVDDPNYIYVLYEDADKKVREKIYKRNDFLKDYEFGKIFIPHENKEYQKYFNFIISKKQFNKNIRANILLTELKKKLTIMKDIKKAYGINLIDNEYTFYEHQIIPLDHTFYNRIFTIQILKQNQNYQGNLNIINNNNINKNQCFPQNMNNNYFN